MQLKCTLGTVKFSFVICHRVWPFACVFEILRIRSNWGAEMVQWREHSPPTNVAGILDSRTRRHMCVEFVVCSRPCSERFFSGYSGFPLSSVNQHFQIPIRSGLLSFSSSLLGSFSNEEGDGNENLKKSTRPNNQNNNSTRASHFLKHFFAVTARLGREIS